MAMFRREQALPDHHVATFTNQLASSPAKTSPATDITIDSYACTYDSSEVPVMITDREGVIKYTNAAFTTLTGYIREETIGKTPRILKSGRYDAFFYERMWNQLLEGRPWHGEIVNRKKDGTLYMDKQTITPITRRDGTVWCIVALRHDTTANWRTERERIRCAEEAAIPKAIQRLAERARTKEELYAGSLHILLGLHEFQGRARGVVFDVVAEQRVIKIAATSGQFSRQFLADEAVLPFGTCLCGRAAVEGRVLVCSDCFNDSRHENKWLGMKAHGHVTIPIRTQSRVLAVMNLYTESGLESSGQRIAFLASIGLSLGAALERLLCSGVDGTALA